MDHQPYFPRQHSSTLSCSRVRVDLSGLTHQVCSFLMNEFSLDCRQHCQGNKLFVPEMFLLTADIVPLGIHGGPQFTGIFGKIYRKALEDSSGK